MSPGHPGKGAKLPGRAADGPLRAAGGPLRAADDRLRGRTGSPRSTKKWHIATDDVLLAADVLRDLIDLGCDDDTGEHLYLADIEW